MKTMLSILAFVACSALAQDHVHPPVVIGPPDLDTTTPKDGIPDFVRNPTMRSVKSGSWSDPTTWDLGRAPETGDCPKVMEAHVVSYPGGTADLQCVGLEGVMVFADAPTIFKTAMLLVYRPGKLHVGTGNAPLASRVEIVIANKPIDYATDPQQFGTGIIVFGELLMQGIAKTPYLRLAQEPRAGAETLTLESAPVGWKPGDKLYLPDTAQYPVLNKLSTAPDVPLTLKGEELRIAGIQGNVVSLTAPLAFDHLAGRDDQGNALLPHIMNLTRNVVVRSEAPQGTRGHILVTERASVSVRDTQFSELGRTTAAILNDAKLINGIWQIGTNQRGRYPFHFHHLMGPRNLSNTGFQFIFTGNAIADCRKWCLALHNSHFGAVQANVIYRADGAGMVTEQGNERENVIEDNFVARIGQPIQSEYNPTYGGVRPPFSTMDFGWEGSCYFLFDNNNYVRRNTCANAAYTGVNLNARPAGFNSNFPNVPNFRGADIAITSEWTNYAVPYRTPPPMRELRDSEVYGSTEGMWTSFSSTGTIANSLVWNVRQKGLYNARNGGFEYVDFKAFSDPAVSNRNYRPSCGICSLATAYTSGGFKLVNPRVSGFNYGLFLPANNELQSASLWPAISPDVDIIGGRFQNNVNVVTSSRHRPGTTTFTNTTFVRNAFGLVKPQPVPGWPSVTVPLDFMGQLEGTAQGAAITPLSRLLAYGYNGSDVEFFMPEQAPGYVMPNRYYPSGTLNRPTTLNCPTAGLTNAQCQAVHGISINDRVATCATVTPVARGFLCPVVP